MSEEIKPCPFCAREVDIDEVRGWYRVICRRCHLMFGSNEVQYFYHNKDRLIKAWNTRA